MKYEKTRGIVLDAFKVGEADKSVLLCTEKFGKISTVAVGALKISARLSSALEPLRDTEIVMWSAALKRSGSMFGHNGGDGSPLKVSAKIISASVIENFEVFIRDKNKIAAAFECARLYNALTPYTESDEGRGYLLLRRAFELLSKCPSGAQSPRLIKTSYALRLLRLSGYDFCKRHSVTKKTLPSPSEGQALFSDGELRTFASQLLMTDGDALIQRSHAPTFDGAENIYSNEAISEQLFLSVKNYIDDIVQGKV